MLLFKLLNFFSSFGHLFVQPFNFFAGVFMLLFGFIEMLFHIPSCCNGLNSKSLLPFNLVFKIVSFTHKLLVNIQGMSHFGNSLIFLSTTFFPESNFCSKHRRQEFSILSYFLKFIINFFLILSCVLKLWDIPIFKSLNFFLRIFKLLFDGHLMILELLFSLLKFLNVHLFNLKIFLKTFNFALVVQLVLLFRVFVFIRQLYNKVFELFLVLLKFLIKSFVFIS